VGKVQNRWICASGARKSARGGRGGKEMNASFCCYASIIYAKVSRAKSQYLVFNSSYVGCNLLDDWLIFFEQNNRTEQLSKIQRGGLMSDHYKIHFKQGDSEYTIESTKRDFINEMLARIDTESSVPNSKTSSNHHQDTEVGVSTAKAETESTKEGQNKEVDILKIVNSIRESDEYEIIEQRILKITARLNKVLLAYYFGHKCGFDKISTKDVSEVTDHLHTKLESYHVGRVIARESKYFTTYGKVKPGVPPEYKLNQKGIEKIKKLLQ
jgi:hypothetical protein